MSPKANKQQGSAAINFCIVAAIFTLLAVLGTLVAFCVGLPSAFGAALDPISAFRLVLDLFSFSKAKAYQCLIGAVIGILYFVNIIWLLKCFTAIAAKIKYIRGSLQTAYDNIKLISQSLGSAFITTFSFVLLTGLFAEGNYTILAYLVLAVDAFVFVLGVSARECTQTYNKISERIFFIATAVYSMAAFAFLFWLFTQQNIGRRAITGIGMLFGGNIGGGFVNFLYSFYLNFIEPLLLMVVVLYIVFMAMEFAREGDLVRMTATHLIPVLVMLGVAIVLQFVCHGLLATEIRNFSTDMLLVWFNNIKPLLLPALAPIIGFFWIKKF